MLMSVPQLLDDWNSSIYQTSCDPGEYTTLDELSRDTSDTLEEPSFAPFPEYPETHYEGASSPTFPAPARSSPFPKVPAFGNFHTPPMSLVVRDVVRHEEQNAYKLADILSPTAVLPPLSDCELLPSSPYSSTIPSSQSNARDSTSSTSNEETLQPPVKAAEKKVRRAATKGVMKRKRSKENYFCCHCSESFTRKLDAERHQRTCKPNPNFSQKEQCKVCTKALPVRLDARRRHWGTLECSNAARERGYPQMDEEYYDLL